MSTNDTNDGVTEVSGRHVLPESLQGPVFAGGVVVGMIVFAVGFAFLVLGVSVDTAPPAPYVYTMTDKFLVLGFGVGSMAVGVGVIRVAARAVGW